MEGARFRQRWQYYPNDESKQQSKGNQRDQRSFLIYPNGTTSFNMYEDDGISTSYEAGQSATTKINSQGLNQTKRGSDRYYRTDKRKL